MGTLQASEFFIIGIDDMSLNEREKQFIGRGLGGIILFKRNIAELEQLIKLNTHILEHNPSTPPLLTVDQEGGRVARLRGICTDIPPLASLLDAVKKNPQLAYRLGALQARELCSLGFNLNFAPVCDILSHEQNEVIGDRAFSHIPEETALFCAEYIRGLQGAGVAGCAKHFPGHGATEIDSHVALPTIDIDFPLLESRELLPFRSAIAASVASIMTAHIVVKPLDDKPATMSKTILSQLLRDTMGFNNVIISDDLTMKAVADNYELKEIIEASVMASVDYFIIGQGHDLCEEAMGILDDLLAHNQHVRKQAMLTQQRIATLRQRYIGQPKAPEYRDAAAILRSRPHLDLLAQF